MMEVENVGTEAASLQEVYQGPERRRPGRRVANPIPELIAIFRSTGEALDADETAIRARAQPSERDDLRPCAGIAVGLAISAVLWAGILKALGIV